MSVVVDVPPVVEAIVKSEVFAGVLIEFEMVSSADGDVEPMPRFPFDASDMSSEYPPPL
jgi:hypothetical protein